jgi:hypothetical protein
VLAVPTVGWETLIVTCHRWVTAHPKCRSSSGSTHRNLGKARWLDRGLGQGTQQAPRRQRPRALGKKQDVKYSDSPRASAGGRLKIPVMEAICYSSLVVSVLGYPIGLIALNLLVWQLKEVTC